MWELHSCSTARQVTVDEFHDLAEGHANLLCDAGFDLLSHEAIQQLEQVWTDANLWSPAGASAPPFPATKLANMSGTEKAVVGRHADIFMRPLFPADADTASLGAMFRPGIRNQLACRLLDQSYAGREHWKADDWASHFEIFPVPWRRFYDEYICWVSRLLRAMSSVYQTQRQLEQDGAVHWLIKMYVAGARLAFGQEFMAEKGIFHRLLHLPQQAQGDASEIESTLRYSYLRL